MPDYDEQGRPAFDAETRQADIEGDRQAIAYYQRKERLEEIRRRLGEENAFLAEAVYEAEQAVRHGQADLDWPQGETATVVIAVRPDGHGKAVVVGLDLLGANEDQWEGDARILQVCER